MIVYEITVLDEIIILENHHLTTIIAITDLGKHQWMLK